MNIADFSVPFFKELTERNIAYAVCGNYEGLPNETEHDIDLWSPTPESIKGVLFEIANNTGYRVFLFSPTANGFNAVFYGPDKNTPWIKVDVMDELSLFSTIPLVGSDLIEKHLEVYKGIQVIQADLSSVMNFLYALFSHGCIKEKYRLAIYDLVTNKKENILRDKLNSLLGRENADLIINMIDQRKWEDLEILFDTFRKKLVANFFMYSGTTAVLRLLRLVSNHLYRMYHKSGYYLAFVGIDGAGKTTVLNDLQKDLEFVFKKKKIYLGYWRPYLFPELKDLIIFSKNRNRGKKNDELAQEDHSISDDRVLMNRRSQKNHNPLKVIFYHFKFLYYWLDFLIGPFFKFWGCWSRGGVALFDRAYIDMELMPERFDFKVPRKFMSVMRSFLPQPDAIFFLWAPPDVIHARKKEFEQDEIRNQIDQYLAYRTKCKEFKSINTSCSVEEVKDRVILSLCDIQEKRFFSAQK